MRALKLNVEVGIFDTHYLARVYHDHVMIVTPYIKWVNNSGSLAFEKNRIPKRPDSLKYMTPDKIDKFWRWAGRQLDDSYLSNQGF